MMTLEALHPHFLVDVLMQPEQQLHGFLRDERRERMIVTCMCVCACVCVYVRKREREREREKGMYKQTNNWVVPLLGTGEAG